MLSARLIVVEMMKRVLPIQKKNGGFAISYHIYVRGKQSFPKVLVSDAGTLS